MGTIVAVRTNQGIAIAADCINTVEEIIHSNLNQADSCITKLGESIIAVNCAYGIQQASQVLLDSLSYEMISELALANKDQVRTFFSTHFEHMKTQQNIITQQNSNFHFDVFPMNALVINRHGIFKVDGTRTVYEYKKYWAIGSGEAFALGALHALHNEEAEAENIARSALKACGAFEANRSRDIVVKSIRLPNLKLAPPEVDKEGSGKGKVLMHRGPVSIRRGKKIKKKDGSPEEE